MAPRLEVDTAALTVVGNQFSALGKELQAAVAPLEPGPDIQPTTNAVNGVVAATNHATRVAGFRVNAYGVKFRRAAAAYDAGDKAGAEKIDRTMRPGG